MAKKKAVAATVTKTTKKAAVAPAEAKAKPVKKKAAGKKRLPVATTPVQTISSEAIGVAAGALWACLAERGPLSLAALKKHIEMHDELVVAAVGWLAREGKLDFEANGEAGKVSLY